METSRAKVTAVQVVKRVSAISDSMPAVNDEQHSRVQWLKQARPGFAEKLSRNMALAAALVICVAAIRAVNDNPTAQTVFETVQNQVEWELDDSLGKLSFVSNLLPEASMVFWNGGRTVEVMAPVQGDIQHVWTAEEPYVSMRGSTKDVRCSADGEVMAVAHGANEELIIRVRHADGYETLYGNLKSVFVSLGDQVYAGDLLGEVMADQAVFFELRQDGRSLDPTYVMVESEADP